MRLTARYEQGEYLKDNPDWHAADAPWKARKVLQLLRRNELVPRTVCDVGCGAGEILRRLQGELPFDTRLVGYDISPQAISLCREKENARLQFVCGDFLQSGREPQDLLLLLDVFEHVPDYLGFLAALRTKARRFVLHIPLDVSVQTVLSGSRRELGMRSRYGHLHYFTAETALEALNDAGYCVEDLLYTWDGECEGGFPPVAPGWKAKAKYPLKYLRYALEWNAFQWRPGLLARLRPSYNLLVLASPRIGAAAVGGVG